MAHLVGMGVDFCQPVGTNTELDTDLYSKRNKNKKS